MQTKIVIDAGSLDDMQRLVGIYDENLNIVTRELCVSASVEGVRLKISGEEGNVALAARVLEGILKLIRAGEPVDKTRIVYCIELAREGNLEGIEQVMSDVVAITSRGKQIKCKTVGQKKYVDAIKKNTVVFGIGPAGTGKTDLAVCLAAGALKGKQVEKIILLYDALQEMFGLETYAKLMEKGVIEVAPLAYMRGRTLSNAFIILDEAQNTTCEQMKMFLTRMGEGSKVVVTGDVTQIDLPEGKRSGLKHAVSVLKNIEGVETVTLTAKDVVRHPLVMAIVHAYERDAARREYIREERKKK